MVEPKSSVSGGLQHPSGAWSVGVVELLDAGARGVAPRAMWVKMQLQARRAAAQSWPIA
jgi:hypothetical protein